MDDSSDVDNSLTDLHHGLDSSFDELPNGLNKHELARPCASASMDAPVGQGVTEDQMNMLQDMVLEMKEGFKNALKELAKIQDKEEGETYHSRKLQQQQQRQLESLTETIHEIKDQLSSLTKSVMHIKDEQKALKGQLEEARTTRSSSQERKPHPGRDRNTEEWKTKLPELPTDFDDHTDSSRLNYETDDNEVTVTACKSLILTQALSDKCLKMNISQSSDEEDEEFENHRTSYHAHKTAGTVSGRIENRRHSMPTSATTQARAKDVGIAAQRQKAVKELTDLEREYCAQLWSLLHTYLTPLQTAGYLNNRELGTLFPPYLDQLYAEHCHICAGLQDRLVHWTYMGSVADLLARITDSHNSESVLSLYKEYVDDLLSAVTCLRRVQAQSSKFRSLLKAVKHSSYRSEDLMSLLLAPVQHIPKYLIQLQQVFRYTPASHADFPILQSSLSRLQAFVNQMNEELSGTAQVLNQDRQLWSSGNSGQMLSARDSGVHSNSTEDDNVLPPKSFSNAKRRSHVSSEWLEEPCYGVHHSKVDDLVRQRYMRPSVSRLSALSQPDLTVYSSLNSYNSEPHTFAQLPRSQSSIPTGAVESGDEISRGRQYRKFKIKRRNQSPVDYTPSPKGHLHRSLSPQVRPSSAIDFLSPSHHHHQQYQHRNNYRDLPVQLKKLFYPERPPRPNSALEPHAADLNHKPTIVSRKHARRSQPLIPAATNFWQETTSSSTLPFRVGHQRMPLCARDLMPKRSSRYAASDVLDGDDEQDEDDTRASDTHSLGTNGSHPYSSGRASSNGHDIDLELYQAHIGGGHSQIQKQAQHLIHSPGFSSAEVTASLARKLCDSQHGSEVSNEGLLLKPDSSEVPESKASQISAEQCSTLSQAAPNQVNISANVKKQYLLPNSAGDRDMFVSHTKSNHEASDEEHSHNSAVVTQKSLYEEHSHNSAVLPKKSLYGNEGSSALFSQKQDEYMSSRSSSKFAPHLTKGVNGDSKEDNDEIKQFSESNRLFLLTASTRCDDRQDQDASYGSTDTGSWASPPSWRNRAVLSHDTNDNAGQDLSNRPEAHLFSPCSYNASAHVNGPLSLNGSLGAATTQSSHPSYRQPQNLLHLMGSRDCDRNSSEMNVSGQRSRPFSRSQTSSNVNYCGSLPTHDTSSLTKMSYSSLDSHKLSHGKQSPLLSFPTCNGISETAQTDMAATDNFQRQVNSQSDPLSYPESHELPPLEVNDPAPDGNNVGRKGDFRKKIKDGGKVHSSDSLPKSIDDPVNARKKMHFKSSIKNLFSKKKGQVILADVEREVVRQMSTAAAKGTQQSQNKVFFRKTAIGNLKDCQTQQKTIIKPTVESTTSKGQSDSSASLTKVAKKSYFDVKQAKSLNRENDRQLSLHEQQQDILHCLQVHNKRHGVVVDSNDVPFSLTTNVGNDSARATRQDNGKRSQVNGDYHSQSKDGSTLYQTSQQRPHNDSTCAVELNGGNKTQIIFSKKVIPKQHQSQTVCKEQVVPINAHVNEMAHVNVADPLKSTPDVGESKILHNKSRETIEPGDISKGRLLTEKYSGHSAADSPSRKLHFSSHDLCQHCQKCEMKQRDKVVSGYKGTISLNSLKNAGSDCERRLKAGHEGSKSQVNKIDSPCLGSNSPNVVLNHNEGNRPFVAEKGIQFPATAKSSSLSFTDCLKAARPMSDSGKTSEVKNCGTLTEWLPDQQADRCKHCSTSPGSSQTTSSKCQQRQSSMATHNMPDVTKISKVPVCSDKIGAHNYLIDTPSEKVCLENVIDLVSPVATYRGDNKMSLQAGHNGMKRNSSSELNSSLSDSCEGKMSASPSSTSLSPQKVVITTSQGYCSTALPQVEPSELRRNYKVVPNGIPRSRSTTLPKAFPQTECSQSFVMEETQNGVIVKRFSLEGKEFAEHKYYGDETSQHRNLKRSENPKSLKALSASSVIAENFKQLPRATHFSYDRNRAGSDQPALYDRNRGGSDQPVIYDRNRPGSDQPAIYDRNRSGSDQPAIYLTLSSPSDDLPEKRQTNNLAASVSDSILTGPRFYLQTLSDSNNEQANLILTAGNSQLSHNRPFYSNLLATSSEETPDNHAPVSQRDQDSAIYNTSADALHDTPSDLRAQVLQTHQGPQEDETSLKHVETNKDLGRDGDTSVVAESVSRQGTSSSLSTALLSDESSSYKPKNPVTNLLPSDVTDCPSSQLLKCDAPNSEEPPNVSLEDASKLYRSFPGHETSSLHQPACMSASYSHEPYRQLTGSSRPRAKDDIQCSDSCRRQQTGSGTLYKRSHGFLRTNSPSDFFSIRPYVDYTASKASSDSGLVVHSDHVRSSTPKGMTFYKGSSSERLNKEKRHTRKARSSSEKSNKCCKSPNKCTENNLEEVENCQPSFSSRSRHSDGAKLNSQEEKCYQAQYPRYSADSSSLISNAFLQKMAHLPKHSTRPVSHPHIDDSHIGSFPRHTSNHDDFSRNGQCSNGAEPTVLASTHSSRSFRITTSAAKSLPQVHNSDVSHEEVPPMNCDKRRSRSTSAKADMTSIQASPDLILSNDGLKEEAAAKEKSPLSRKAQSFFSKLTHSPISLFYRDSKPPNPPK